MKVIVNATPLIALSLINQLELLNKLFDQVFVPLAVYQEVVIQGSGQPGSAELASIKTTTGKSLVIGTEGDRDNFFIMPVQGSRL